MSPTAQCQATLESGGRFRHPDWCCHRAHCDMQPLTHRRLSWHTVRALIHIEYAIVHVWLSLVLGMSSLLRVLFMTPWSIATAAVESVILHGMCLIIQAPAGMFVVHVHAALHLYNVLLYHGLVAVSRSFTYGEAMVVSQGMTFLIMDAILYTLQQGGALHQAEPYAIPPRDGIAIVLQIGLIVSVLLLPLLCVPLFHVYGTSTPRIVRPTLPPSPTALFVGLVGFVAVVFTAWTSLLLDTTLWTWVVDVFLVPSKVGVAAYWATTLVAVVPLCPILARRWSLRQIVARKLYHFVVVLLFLPVTFVDVDMLRLSYGVAVGVFIVVECIRALAAPPFGRSIALYMRMYLDHRDDGRLILSHTYLLLGCALPLWILYPTSSTTNLDESTSMASAALISNAGVLALGIGDAMGATIGSMWGATKVVGNKSLEGSVAVFVSMGAASLVCHSYHVDLFLYGRYAPVIQWLGATLVTAMLEAVTCQIDNLVLPLYYCATLCLTACSLYP
ncbi:hypothetical protein, variant 1 [Aphanomyces invadans]|uniref:dolichol kinase n=1 Tax=Aphanomyces invadans TaxID=157072 RepID=A0A024URD6_9STRA|nr:hypothetical protein, variant 1 [Aphanomyces invadans]ETW08996.1 hypothetical protein, variant 1 [Aphanomyces invadans]|eukprot:XP_008862801.1 hypothetical protein, variant 1 [Aphanomyces invadans]